MMTRRQVLLAATATAVFSGLTGAEPAWAADKVVKIGIDLSLTLSLIHI